MSDIFGKLVESAGQVISEVDKGDRLQSAISGLRQRMAEADRKRRITLVKEKIKELRSEEAHSISALSGQVLALHEAGSLTQPELVSLCRGVDEIRERIREAEAELEQLQPPTPPAEPVQRRATVPEPSVRCPSCAAAIVGGASFCQSCGARLAKEEPTVPVLFCVHCGAQLRQGALFCPKCGLAVPEA
jgi:hypothetical protein